MALAPLNKSRRVQGREYRAEPGTDCATDQYGYHVRKTSMRPAPSRPFARASAYTRFPWPGALSLASSERLAEWRLFVLALIGPEDLESIYFTQFLRPRFDFVRFPNELERRYEENRRFDDSSFDKMASGSFNEESWTLDGSWGRKSWVEVGKAARPFHIRSARVFEYTPSIGSVTLPTSHAHPDGILTLEITNDGVGLLSNDLMGRELVERWKAGPGRKKAWKTAPRPRFANKDWARLLRYSQQREATSRSCSAPLQNSELISSIKQASISSSIPILMFEHGMAGQDGSQIYPKPSVLKNAARRFGIFTSNTSRPRTRSKPFSPKATRFVNCVGVDDEEDDDDSFEPGPLDGYSESDRLTDMENDMWV